MFVFNSSLKKESTGRAPSLHDIVTPRACARGKVIGLSVVVVSTKIATLRDVETLKLVDLL